MLKANHRLPKACTMLKSLHLKNWRSIRDAKIEFSPINVLIGANASGKTNILDALYFAQQTLKTDVLQAIYRRGGGDKIQNLNSSDEAVMLDYSYQLPNFPLLNDKFELEFVGESKRIQARRTISENNNPLIFLNSGKFSDTGLTVAAIGEGIEKESLRKLRSFVTMYWQLLTENFMPPLSAHLGSMGDLYTIEPDARNTVFILDFMKQTQPKLYESLQEDLRFLVGHISHLDSKRDELEVYLALHENKFPEKESPTVSAGTARILAILAAVYALDMRNPEMSGLVVIEEPETSLNPSLLRNFVELLRGYTENPEKPRQFILTTHNPSFLNHFQPEEVRVVSRDEDGNTVVNPIPDYIREIWLNEHGLGDAWLTNAFGGVAE
jgi:predicted ATPase